MTRGGTQYAPFPWRDPCAAAASAVASRSRWSSYRCGTPRPLRPLAGVTEQSAADLWADVSGRLRADLPDGVFAAWFGAARPVGFAGDDLQMGVPNEFTRAWIEGHFGELVRQAASEGGSGSRCASRSSATMARQRPSNRENSHASHPSGERPSGLRDRARDQLPPEVHVRVVRHRLVQPLLARRSARRRRGARPGVQPAPDPRGHRPRQDAPPAGDRAVRPAHHPNMVAR